MTTTNVPIIKKLLLIFLIIAGLIFAKEFLMPIFIGGILATLFIPFCNFLEKKHFNKGLSAFICLLMLLLIFSSIILLVSLKISELVNDAELIKQKAIDSGIQLQEYIFNHLGISLEKQSQILQSEQPSISSIMQFTFSSLSYLITNVILVLAYFFFLLYYRVHFKQFFLKLTAAEKRDEMSQILSKATNVSQQYLLGMSKMIVCLWLMYGVGFSILGVKNAIFFAVLCGLLEIVPFIGNITGTSLTVLVTGLHGASLSLLGGIVLIYAIVQFIQGWVLEPLILGPQVKINPLFTIIALVVGELLWGISGIVLAIPITAMLKIVCDYIEPLKPYGFLIGEIESEKKESVLLKKLKTKFLS